MAQGVSRSALLVTGRIEGGRQWLDAERLAVLGPRTIEAVPPWSDGPERLEGVPLAELLAHVGAEGQRIELRDARGHSLGVAIHDVVAGGAFLAARRDRGPFWLVFAHGPPHFGPPPMAGLVELRVR